MPSGKRGGIFRGENPRIDAKPEGNRHALQSRVLDTKEFSTNLAEIDHREMPFTAQLIGYFHMEIFIFYFLSSLGAFLTLSVFISSNSGAWLGLVVGCL